MTLHDALHLLKQIAVCFSKSERYIVENNKSSKQHFLTSCSVCTGAYVPAKLTASIESCNNSKIIEDTLMGTMNTF